jgi:amino acid permease
MLKAMLGTGILSFPFSFYYCGYLGSIVILLITAISVWYSGYLMDEIYKE